MRAKTIRQIEKQAHRVITYNSERFTIGQRLRTYENTFIAHFGVRPHTKECKAFISKYGKHYAM